MGRLIQIAFKGPKCHKASSQEEPAMQDKTKALQMLAKHLKLFQKANTQQPVRIELRWQDSE
jgi:hypothetical protein